MYPGEALPFWQKQLACGCIKIKFTRFKLHHCVTCFFR